MRLSKITFLIITAIITIAWIAYNLLREPFENPTKTEYSYTKADIGKYSIPIPSDATSLQSIKIAICKKAGGKDDDPNSYGPLMDATAGSTIASNYDGGKSTQKINFTSGNLIIRNPCFNTNNIANYSVPPVPDNCLPRPRRPLLPAEVKMPVPIVSGVLQNAGTDGKLRPNTPVKSGGKTIEISGLSNGNLGITSATPKTLNGNNIMIAVTYGKK
jgi:hypothetical protein